MSIIISWKEKCCNKIENDHHDDHDRVDDEDDEDAHHLHVGFAVVHLDRLLSAHPPLLLLPLLHHHHHHQDQDQNDHDNEPTCKMSLERLCAASIDFRCIPGRKKIMKYGFYLFLKVVNL